MNLDISKWARDHGAEHGLGHRDMFGGDRFNWTKEDHGPTGPTTYEGATRNCHFQDLKKSQIEVDAAIELRDRDLFERAVHRGQDYWSHYLNGYTQGVPGHVFNLAADDVFTLPQLKKWIEAYSWTKQQVDRWDSQQKNWQFNDTYEISPNNAGNFFLIFK